MRTIIRGSIDPKLISEAGGAHIEQEVSGYLAQREHSAGAVGSRERRALQALTQGVRRAFFRF